MTPTLRAMKSTDVTAVLILEKALYPFDAWSGAQFLDELRGVPSTRYFTVLEEGDQIIGYAGLMAVGEHGDIQTLSVDTAYQGQGLGQLLLDDLEAEARRRKVEAIFLEVRIGNDPAIGLYRKNGYQELGQRNDYYGPGVDALVMRKVIA